jgi:mRNA interferase MazF
MKRGTVVLTPFPFTDLTTIKRRPAVIVSKVEPLKNDLIVAFISSVIFPNPSDTDLYIDFNDPDFKNTGLIKTSIIKADKLMTIEKQLFTGELGCLSDRLLRELDAKLKIALNLNF